MHFLGKIGITLDISFPHPKTDSAEDKIAAELALQFYVSNFDLFFSVVFDFFYQRLERAWENVISKKIELKKKIETLNQFIQGSAIFCGQAK